MTGKKWVELNEPMGDCRCCVHQDECAPLKKTAQKQLNGKYRFRCPILIEVDEDIVYVGRSKSKKRKVKNDG